MEYLIAAACSVWLVAFLLLEDRAGGRTGHALRLLGTAPLLVLLVLAWTDRFSYDALMIALVTILVSTTVGSLIRWKRRRTEPETDRLT